MTTLEEIFDFWQEDARIDRLELGNAALDIPKLHHKYYRMMSIERMILRKQESEFAVMMQNKKTWCSGELTSAELSAFGWQPHLKKILKTDIDDYLKADADVIKFTLKMALQKEKLEALDSIIKTIINRSFQISNAVNWAKFQSGM